jgi:dTDP-4-dehydrorhamnose 3,5-epimerase
VLRDVGQLGGAQLIEVRRFGDDRGYFSETFNAKTAAGLGVVDDFVQDNESLSATAGTIRGLHYQVSPHAQGKLVRVVVGAVIDVVVDIRAGSPTFGDHAMVRLDGINGLQLWIPPGFAHGFCSLESNMVMAYKVTDFYNAEADRSMQWNDSELGIIWPGIADPSSLSAKDSEAPTFAELRAKGELF